MATSVERVKRWAGAHWLRTLGRVAADRRELYGGATGLRAVTFHETLPGYLPTLQRVVDWCRRRFELATPEDADALFEGRFRPGARDRMLVTFDDGLESNHRAARWLADQRISAIFFVVPSLVDRTMAEYLRFHQERGVAAHAPRAAPGARGLSTSQVRELLAMGHRVGAHNYAHRDLGRLHQPSELRYEVQNALDEVGRLTGRACRDFAIGFGQPENVSPEAAAYLRDHVPHVYACHRGLNLPGRSPRFVLRHTCEPEHPLAFTRLCLEGGADRVVAGKARAMLELAGALPDGPTPPRG